MSLTSQQRGAFWRKLETLLRVGMSLTEALALLEKQSPQSSGRLWIGALRGRLEMGLPFSQAAEGLRPTERELLKAAEATGEFRAVVATLAQLAEDAETLGAQIRSALTYPTMVAVVCVGLWIFLVGAILPRFEKLFAAVGVSGGLPPFTAGVIAFSKMMAMGGWVGFLLILAAIVWGIVTAPPRAWKRIPLVGRLRQKAFSAEFFCALGLLTRHGVAFDKAIGSALAVAGVPSVAAEACARRIAGGDRAEAVLRSLEVFPAEELEIVSMAERSAAVPETAERLGRLGRERYGIELKQAVGVLEPVLIVFMALTVAVLVGALFAPLMPLIGRLSEGV